MAEDFPRYRHEESDDHVSVGHDHEHVSGQAGAEYIANGQEGTIFSRDKVSASLSRPLFEFIRRQEQPEAKRDMPPLPIMEALPSVSAPSEPEMRTYQPPVEQDMPLVVEAPQPEPSPVSEKTIETPAVMPPAPERPPTPVHTQERQERPHKGRWFTAGVITGWVTRQYLANRRQSPVREMPLQNAAPTGETPFAAANRMPSAGEYRAPFAPAPPNTPNIAPNALLHPEYTQPIPQAPPMETAGANPGLQQGQHIEHATGGGHNIIVDRHGREVQNAMDYGEEFHAQRRQEQLRVDAFTSGQNNGQAQDDNAQIAGLPSGQAAPGHGLPAGQLPPAARQRLLGGQHNSPVVAAMLSPWLWASVIVLLIAFFVAAFI